MLGDSAPLWTSRCIGSVVGSQKFHMPRKHTQFIILVTMMNWTEAACVQSAESA